MFEAQYLIAKLATGVSTYSPWMARGGDNARFTVDVDQAEGGLLDVEVQTKNSEDAGDSGSVIAQTASSLSSAGQTTFATTAGSEELVRYKFTMKASENGIEGFVLFRMLSPVWFDAVKA